jgi:hypothetical protein
MSRMTGYLCLLLVGVATASVGAAPEPAATRVAWELKLETSAPTRIEVGGTIYWYILYTVNNDTGQDVDFQPEIVRVSEIDTELPADKVAKQPNQASQILTDPSIVGVPSPVFAAIQQLTARTHPFLVTPVKAIGRILQGKDNAVTSVAVFKDLDPRAGKFTIYFSGLSGEQRSLPNPKYDPKAGDKSETNPKVFVLRKTLAMPYTLPGDARTRRVATPALGRLTWVMR